MRLLDRLGLRSAGMGLQILGMKVAANRPGGVSAIGGLLFKPLM